MKKFFAGFIAVLLSSFLAAQEPVNLPAAFKDSVNPEIPLFYEPGIDFPESGLTVPGFMDFKTNPELPVFDFSRYLISRWNIGYHSFPGDDPFFSNFSSLTYFRFFSPFDTEGAIFNQAIYRVSDKLVVGGNSFGINSVFRPSIPRFGSNSWDFRGASFFMEYKVSKNFRIGGGISVTDRPLHP